MFQINQKIIETAHDKNSTVGTVFYTHVVVKSMSYCDIDPDNIL